jgi:hypothetical protein
VFNWDINHCFQNFSSEIYDIPASCNFGNTFLGREVCNLESIQNCLINQEISNWDVARHNKDKLRTYNIFKWNYECEEYVYMQLSRRARSLVAQFRCGILPLQIEIGRYRNIPVADRRCFSCANGIEDEYHILCICPVYNNIREELYSIISNANPSFDDLDLFDKFLYICVNSQKPLAKFLCKMMERRRSLLFEC